MNLTSRPLVAVHHPGSGTSLAGACRAFAGAKAVHALLACFVLLWPAGVTHAQDDDTSPTSLNRSISVVPAPGPVTIDGKTEDWDLSAGVWSYNSPVITESFSVWTHLMWDARGIYFLARFADKSPMANATMGRDFANSWKADCYQARVILDDRTPDEHQMHINLFYSTPDRKPFMIVKHGGFGGANDQTGRDRPDLLERFGQDMERWGGKIAIVPAEGGYHMEAFWPWSYLRLSGKPLAAGDSFVFGIEALWGNSDGTRGNHRLADGIKNDKVNRIFMFRARDGWGSAVLQEKGRLSISAQQRELHARRLKQFVDYDTTGTIPIRYVLPEDRDVTIAIDNDQGVRVRNLFGQYPRPAGSVTDLWDGLDDRGKPVPAGRYTAQVLDHQPIRLRFLNSLYNAGTPPWATDSGRKIWGADHGHPTSIATRGDAILCCFTGVESGTGLLRCGRDGIIQWCDVTETVDACMDDRYAYALSSASGAVLRRFNLTTGKLVPFDDERRSPEALFAKVGVPVESSIAFAGGKLFAMIVGAQLYRVDPATGAAEAAFTVPGLRAVTSHQDGLVGLFADGTVATLNADGARGRMIVRATDAANPVRVAIAPDGRVAVTDRATHRVLLIDAAGKPVRAVGAAHAAAERPAGKFVETDLANPLGAAFDSQGRLWVAEASKNCKRVTVWSDKGELQQSFWGAADYGAMAGFPITFDSTRFVAHGVEFQLDPNPDPKSRPTAEKPLIYHPELANERGVIYRYQGHEYAAMVPSYNARALLTIAKRDGDGVFRSCAQLRRPAAVYWSVGWVRPDLTIITPDCRVFPLQGLSDAGVPRYDFDSPLAPANKITKLDAQGSTGTIVMDRAGNISDGIRFHTVDGRSGAYPNLYGRHDAPAARRGVLIAPFRTNGVVEDVPGVGSITALGGDRGEWFLMTMDGLYLSSICQDIKGEVTLDETFIGGESFGGFIWRDERSRVLVQLGGNSYRLMEVLHLDTCRKQQIKLEVTDEQIADGARMAREGRAQVAVEPAELKIARVAALPAGPCPPEGGLAEPLIAGAAAFRVQEPGNALRWWRASLAHDGKSLAIMFQVADGSPWMNAEARFTHAFIGGDCVDLQLDAPGRGPVRLLAASVGGKDTAVYFQKTSAAPQGATTYSVGNNAANAESIDVVRVLGSAAIKQRSGISGYSVLLTVPLAELGIDLAGVSATRGLLGVIFSDPAGRNRAARVYWFDKNTSMVNDVPSEARMRPERWGRIVFEN